MKCWVKFELMGGGIGKYGRVYLISAGFFMWVVYARNGEIV